MHQYIWEDDNWTQFRWKAGALLTPLAECRFEQGKLLSQMVELGVQLRREAQVEILTEETIQTAAIEGQSFDKNSVRSSVVRRLGLPTAGLPPPDRYADGLVEVLLDATLRYDQPLAVERLHGWQAALFPTGYSGLHRITVGDWRGPAPMQVISGPIGRETIHYQAPPADRIDREMKWFFGWWDTSRNQVEGILRAGIAHFWFVTIHPYEDGNGRLARALTDMALAQDEKTPTRFYSLSAQIMAERDDYYDILERSQRGTSDITEWLHWFLGCFRRAVNRSKMLLGLVLLKAKFWQQHKTDQLNDRQRKVIDRLLDAGPGGFEGGLTTRKYVSMAKTSRATAYREITDLVNKGILTQNPGKGRNVSYELNWPADDDQVTV